MSQTLNDVADGFKAVANAIDPSIRFYAEPDEKPDGAGGKINGEVFFRNLKMVNAAAKLYDVDAIIELSTPANQQDWSAAVRRIRDLASPYGTRSLWAAVIENPTLGGRVGSARALDGALLDETRKKFADGDRWCQEIGFKVRLAA